MRDVLGNDCEGSLAGLSLAGDLVSRRVVVLESAARNTNDREEGWWIREPQTARFTLPCC